VSALAREASILNEAVNSPFSATDIFKAVVNEPPSCSATAGSDA
jgi:hypothetical protein